jgi:hypothetical protein
MSQVHNVTHVPVHSDLCFVTSVAAATVEAYVAKRELNSPEFRTQGCEHSLKKALSQHRAPIGGSSSRMKMALKDSAAEFKSHGITCLSSRPDRGWG